MIQTSVEKAGSKFFKSMSDQFEDDQRDKLFKAIQSKT